MRLVKFTVGVVKSIRGSGRNWSNIQWEQVEKSVKPVCGDEQDWSFFLLEVEGLLRTPSETYPLVNSVLQIKLIKYGLHTTHTS